MSQLSTDYRARIYRHYVHARQRPLSPATLDGLKPRVPFLNRIIREHFPPDRSAAILDVGCGHGALIHQARQAGYRNIRGVDTSLEQVAEAKRLGIAGVVEGDLLNALRPLTNGSQDCIVAFDVIEHFTKAELLPFIDQVYRVLRSDGKLIAHTPNAESPFAGRILFGDFTHELAFTRTSIAQLLLASGFAEVVSYEDAPVPHGVKSVIRWGLWKLIRTLLRLYIAAESGYTGRDCIFSQNFLTVAVK